MTHNRSGHVSQGFRGMRFPSLGHKEELDVYLKASWDVEKILGGDKKLFRELRSASQSLLRLKEQMERGSKRVAEKQLEAALSRTRSLLLKAYAMKQ
ncbi:MAG: hypothetical protein JRN52_04470 [Nitrososphaerota archaeon]|nr:hypothetical protein [Nitrososphaerota archaeon]